MYIWLRKECYKVSYMEHVYTHNALYTTKQGPHLGNECLMPTVKSTTVKSLIQDAPKKGNEIVDHSDVVGASPVGAAPITSSFST